MSNVIKQESSISPEKERRKLSLQEVRLKKIDLEPHAEVKPEALIARAKAEADRMSEQAASQVENIRRQIEQEKTIGQTKGSFWLRKRNKTASNKAWSLGKQKLYSNTQG